MAEWSERVAVVTGASSGIGRAIALALAARGAFVWLVARRESALAEVAGEALRDGASTRACCADLTRDADIHELQARVRRDSGRLDLLIHCAGIFSQGALAAARTEDLDAQYRSNVRAPYALSQALLPLLQEAHGEIVFVNSSAAVGDARAEVGQYAATKAALKAVADSLREEVNADGIRVLSVFPGRTATPLQASIHAQEGKDYEPGRLLQPEDVGMMVVSALELPRTAEVTEISMRPFAKPPASA